MEGVVVGQFGDGLDLGESDDWQYVEIDHSQPSFFVYVHNVNDASQQAVARP